MQIKCFSIPVNAAESIEEEVNKFLRTHRILQMERHFCAEGGGYWALLVEYADLPPTAEAPPASRRERKDVAKELNEEERARYDHFRDIRHRLAVEHGIPAYLVFTNEELGILARIPELCAETVQGIKGIAPSRLRDFVSHFFVVSEANDETGGTSDGADSLSGESA